MANTPPPAPTEPQRPLYTTNNEGLGNDIATLKSIFDGEYVAFDVEKQLRHVAHNLGILLSLHLGHNI